MTTNAEATDADPPKRKRAKQKPLVDGTGEPLKTLDADGHPIEQGVVSEKVRERVEDYSAATFAEGEKAKEKKEAELLLNEAMHEAGIRTVIAKDHNGMAYEYRIKTTETIKRRKLKTQVDE